MKRAVFARPQPPEDSPADHARIAEVPRNNRSHLGNGSILPAGVDGRSSAARRWKEIYRDAMRRAGNRSESLCRQLATLTLRRESLDAEVAAGRPVDVDLLLRLSSEERRTMTRLGIVEEDEQTDGTDDAIAALRANAEARA